MNRLYESKNNSNNSRIPHRILIQISRSDSDVEVDDNVDDLLIKPIASNGVIIYFSTENSQLFNTKQL